MIAAVDAATFVPPTGKIAPFRRDQLPISDRAIDNLSYQITTITSASPYETAEHRRAVVKALALALALNPKNESAKNILDRLIEGEKPSFADKGKLDYDKRQAWNSLEWLSSPEAGQDGNVLAAMLGETLANIFPTDSLASSYLAKPEHPGWNGWVAELANFKKEPTKKEDPKVDDKKEEIAVTPPKVLPKYDPTKGVVMDMAKLSTVLRIYDKDKSLWLHKVVPLQMRGTNHPTNEDGEEQHGFRVQVSASSNDYWQMEEELSSPLKNRLTKHLVRLPERAEINVSIDSENSAYPFSRNRGAISGPAFVLANAALTGIAPDGIVIGEIDRSSGNLKLPAYFWRALMVLAEGSGGRLIIPASAEPMLINLLALEKPEFFLKYEVLIASSLEEFVTLASMESSPQHEEVYNKFKLIKEKSAGSALGAYLTNKFVRERLQEIVAQAPYHLSAKTLLIYSSVSRPRYLTREALAAEIWRKIDVITELEKIGDYYDINSNQLARMNDLYEQMRDDIKVLDRYTETRNDDLLKEAKSVIASVRGFGREFEGSKEMWEKVDEIQAAHGDMKRGNRAFVQKLAEITGDPLPK
ncbi:MAG: hypothetical protein ACK5JP_09260 [Akkermansiaceae bacterium]|jgi:hypothetical protein